MVNKDFAVLGLGKFGASVARSLMALNRNVIAIDKNDANVQDLASEVTYCVKADVTNPEALKSIGISNVDVAVIATSGNIEASVMATILIKEMGVKTVVAKANSELHRKILLKVGADVVIFPEQEMGNRLARNLVGGSFTDIVDVSNDISIIEIGIKDNWRGNSIKEINLRKNYGVNIVAVKNSEGKLDVNPDPDKPLTEEMTLVIIGNVQDLNRLAQIK